MAGANGFDAAERTAAQAAAQARDHEVAVRLCQAEVQAALEKYGITIGIRRSEMFVNGQSHVEYSLLFVPRGS